MNKELEKIIHDHPHVNAKGDFDNAALGRVRGLSDEIKKRAMDLNNLCVNYHAEVTRQHELKGRRDKAIAAKQAEAKKSEAKHKK
jgi:hypothetical protein